MGAEEDKSDGTKEIYRECCRCYVGLYITIPLDKEVDVNAKWECDYCKDKTLNDAELLQRQLDVMNKAYSYRLRVICKLFSMREKITRRRDSVDTEKKPKLYTKESLKKLWDSIPFGEAMEILAKHYGIELEEFDPKKHRPQPLCKKCLDEILGEEKNKEYKITIKNTKDYDQ